MISNRLCAASKSVHRSERAHVIWIKIGFWTPSKGIFSQRRFGLETRIKAKKPPAARVTDVQGDVNNNPSQFTNWSSHSTPLIYHLVKLRTSGPPKYNIYKYNTPPYSGAIISKSTIKSSVCERYP